MTIYTPRYFAVNDRALSHEIMRRYNFATLISHQDGRLMISHLPFLFEPDRGTNGTLWAHVARANPQWHGFRSDAEVTVIFQGPHAYVSPRWYQPQPDNVPTWNYAVVHAHGVPRLIEDQDAAFAAMQRLSKHHDPEWSLSLSDQDRYDLMHAIVVFEIEVTKLEAKFKLSQNRLGPGHALRHGRDREAHRTQTAA